MMTSKCTHVLIIGLWTITFVLLANFLAGQTAEKQSLQLLDKTTKDAIVGADFVYGQQSGNSDELGMIQLSYKQVDTLIISHISYGQWNIEPDQLKKALKSGTIFRKEEVWKFQPLTIIGLHPKKDERQSFELKDQDRLAHDAGEILLHSPAISGIRKSGSYGCDPVLRGFKYDQINIVIDGAQCAAAACPNRMDPPSSQIAPNMMERVDIMKGPHSLRYGNALGGTINFRSADPRYTEETETYGRVSGIYESNGSIIRTEGMIGWRGQKYDLGLFGSWSESDDYEDGEGIQTPSEFQRGSAGLKLGLKLSEKQELKLSATRNFARDSDFPALPMDLRSDDTWLLNLAHNVKLSGKKLKSWNTNAFATFVDHVMDNLLKPLDPRMLNASTNAETRSYGGRTEGNWILGNTQLYAGADLRVEEAKGIRVREFLLGPNAGKILEDNAWQNSQISKTGIFAEYHLRKNDLRLIFSGRLEINQAKVKEAGAEFTDIYGDTDITQVNPGISIGGIKELGAGLTMGLWLGRTQRSGSISERYINFFPIGLDPYELVGNPELDPEVNNQLDLTFGYKSANSKIDVSLFSSFLKNYISSEINPDLKVRIPSSPGVRQFINIDDALLAGFEITWNQHLLSGISHFMSIAYTYGQDLDRDEALPEIAPLDFRYLLSGDFINDKLHTEIGFRHVLQQDRISNTYGETETPSFSIVDMKASYIALPKLNLGIGIQNIFDVAYYEHLNRSVRGKERAIYAPGRSFVLSLTLDLTN